MPLYVYHKASLDTFRDSLKPFHIQVLPTLISVAGLLLIAFVIWPIVSYELQINSSQLNNKQSGLISPVVGTSQQSPKPKVVGVYDYTKPQNWFPHDRSKSSSSLDSREYQLAIPKLKIDQARVIIGGENLNEGLVHYPDTALPGELGSPVIFGHSILPQFYDPNNYLAIFSLLPKLENGDEIFLNYDNIVYTYQVIEKQEVFPDDLWVLRQKYDSKNLKLITCVPPGLKTRRLVVTAKLISK